MNNLNITDKKNEFGITIITLIITIVILIICVAVAITILGRQNGEITKEVEKSSSEYLENREESALDNSVRTKRDSTAPGGIKDFTKLEDGTYKDSNNNEWVWIEVPNDGTGPIYPSNATDKQIYDALRTYCSDIIPTGTNGNEKDRNVSTYGYIDIWHDDCGLSESEYNLTRGIMLQSIKTNGGFYIGKYETGYEGSSIRTDNEETTQTAVIKENVYPYNWVTCSQAQSLAKGIEKPNGKTTSLLFGIQWDLVLKYIKVKNAKTVEQIRENSTTWGNYENASFLINRGMYNPFNFDDLTEWKKNTTNTKWYVSSMQKNAYDDYENVDLTTPGVILTTTGASNKNQVLNIYDLAGNLNEWTLEKTSDSRRPCAIRGGDFYNNGDDTPVSYRNDGDSLSQLYIGFRVALY